jgi:hypothetical protein
VLSCGSCVCISSVGVCMIPAGMCFIWHCSLGVYGCENRGGRYINGLRAEKVHFADINRYNLHFGSFLTYSYQFRDLFSLHDDRRSLSAALRLPFQEPFGIILIFPSSHYSASQKRKERNARSMERYELKLPKLVRESNGCSRRREMARRRNM